MLKTSLIAGIFSIAYLIAQPASAGCPDDVFMFTKGSVWFSGPRDGRVHTQTTNQADYYTVDNFNIITDLKYSIRLYSGHDNCVDIGTCTDASGYHQSIKNISIYDYAFVDKETGELRCDGNLLYSRMY
jgi:hypothetical protein